MDFVKKRLLEERKQFRKDHPIGFFAKPIKTNNSELDLFNWDCGILAPDTDPWCKSELRVSLAFTKNYPRIPPKVRFVPSVPHPNVYSDGSVCLDLISSMWKPDITISQILIGLQKVLRDPNPRSPANGRMAKLYKTDMKMYNLEIGNFLKRLKK